MEFHMQKNSFTTQLEYGELQVSGDAQYGFRPYQLLVSSVAVCTGGVLRKILEKQKVEFSDITIKADFKRNDKGAEEVTAIHLNIAITGSNLREEKLKKAMHLAHKNCSMTQSVKGCIEVTESLTLVNE